MITQQSKTFGNPNIADIKSLTIEHRKTSHTSSKTIIQAEKTFQKGSGKSPNSPLNFSYLYVSNKKKCENN